MSVGDPLGADEARTAQQRSEARWVYDLLVRMALAAGWRRDRREGNKGKWFHPDEKYPIHLVVVVGSVLRDHGVDLRESVPGEETP